MKKSLLTSIFTLAMVVLTGHAWGEDTSTTTLPTAVYLLDAGSTATEGWTQINKNGSYPAFLQDDTTNGSVYMTSTSGGNFFNTYVAPANGFADGTYVGLNGTEYTSVLAEMAASLGLESIPSSVYSDNLSNGGQWGHTVTVYGLDASKTYVMYYIGGANKDNQTVAGFTLTSGGYQGSPKVEYVCTSGSSGHNTSTVTEYTTVSATTAMRAAKDGYLLVRVSYVQPTQSGTIQFTLSGERSNICALAIAEIEPLPEAITHNREINSADETWDTASEWTNGTLPVATDIVNLTAAVEGAKLTIDTAAVADQLSTAGDYTLTFDGSESLTAASTVINTDTDASAISSSFGAVTIADGKTLSVGALASGDSFAGNGTLKVNANSSWTAAREAGLKNLYINNCTLTSTYVSGGSGIASGRTITVDGEGAVLYVNVGDGTGYDNGTDSKIAIKNGGKLLYGSRDTLKTAVELTGGTVEIAAEAGNNNRALDLYNSNDTVADFTVLAAEDATAENPTVSYISPLGTGIHRALHLRAGVVEFNVADKAALEISGYLVNNAGGGSSENMKKTGAGLMTLRGDNASSCTTAIAVEAGTLKIIDSASTGSGAVTVNSGATIAGNGTIGGALTLAAGAAVDATAGALTVSGDVTFGESLNVKLASAPTVMESVQVLAKIGLTVGDVANVALSVVVGDAAADTESYKLVATDAGYAVAVDYAAAVTINGETTGYETFAEAYSVAANSSEAETITLLADYTAESLVMPYYNTLVLADGDSINLNGYTLTAPNLIGTLAINGGSFETYDTNGDLYTLAGAEGSVFETSNGVFQIAIDYTTSAVTLTAVSGDLTLAKSYASTASLALVAESAANITIAEGVTLNLMSSATVKGKLTCNGSIVLGAADAKLTTSTELGDKISTTVNDKVVVYANGVYSVGEAAAPTATPWASATVTAGSADAALAMVTLAVEVPKIDGTAIEGLDAKTYLGYFDKTAVDNGNGTFTVKAVLKADEVRPVIATAEGAFVITKGEGGAVSKVAIKISNPKKGLCYGIRVKNELSATATSDEVISLIPFSGSSDGNLTVEMDAVEDDVTAMAADAAFFTVLVEPPDAADTDTTTGEVEGE